MTMFRKLGYAAAAALAVACGSFSYTPIQPPLATPSYTAARPTPTRAHPSPTVETRIWIGFDVDCSHIPLAGRTEYVRQRMVTLLEAEKVTMPALSAIDWQLHADGGVFLKFYLHPPQPSSVAEPYGIDAARRLKTDFCPRPALQVL